MKYQHILAAFYGQPLALMPEKIEAIRRFLMAKSAGGEIEPAEVEAITATRRPDGVQMIGRVAVLPIIGVLSQRVGMIERASGGISTEEIGVSLEGLARDKSVRAIVLAVDSPGGSVAGIDELAAKIRAARDIKKVVGIADSVAASAGYWLLAQASEVNVTPGGMVGSVGVWTAHTDISKAEDLKGEKTTLISAGEYKVEGNPFGPLTEAARAELQRQVDHYYGMFVAALAKGRGVSEAKVRSDFGKGRMAMAAEAVAAGMADRVATIDQVIRRLGGYDSASPPTPVGAQLAAVRARAVEVDQEK